MAFAPVNYKVSMRLPSLDGGLNTKFTDVSTPLNASPDCQDVLLDDFGAVRTTRGYSKFNSTQLPGSAVIDGLSTYLDISGDRILMAASNGSIYQQSGSSFTVVANSVYTAGVDVKFLNINSWIVMGDGYVPLYKWNGTSLYRFGATPPDSAVASAVTTVGGNLQGTYDWAISYINSANAESDYVPIVQSFTVVDNSQVTITGIPTAPVSYGVDIVNLYRTTANVSAVYWLVTAMSAGQTSVVDNNADPTLIYPAIIDQGTPPKAKYMVYYRGRMFAAGDEANPYRLYYSNAGAVETWPSTNYLGVEEGDGYPISAIEAFGNSIVIHKNDGKGYGSIYLLYIADSTGTVDESNWYLFKSPAAFSAISDKSQSFFRNLLFYISRYGAYAFTGQDLARTSADSEYGRFQTESLTYDIDPDVKQWSPSLLPKSASVMYDNKIYLAVPIGGTSYQNNRIYVFDFVRIEQGKLGVWTKLSAPSVNNFVVSDGSLYAGGYAGYVYKLDTGTLYDGAVIAPYFWTAAISGNAEHRDNTKVFRILYVTLELSGAWNLYVDYQVDFGGDTQTGTINMSPGGTLWGSFKWKVGTWGGGATNSRKRLILTNAVGKLIKFKFYVTGLNQTFRIKELELDYNLRTKRG